MFSIGVPNGSEHPAPKTNPPPSPARSKHLWASAPTCSGVPLRMSVTGSMFPIIAILPLKAFLAAAMSTEWSRLMTDAPVPARSPSIGPVSPQMCSIV